MKKLIIFIFLFSLGVAVSTNAGGFKFAKSQYKNGKRISIKDKVQRRRISILEKELINSNGAKKINIFGRMVVKRDIFKCNRKNITLMLNGNVPFGFDGKRVELHHLKQQKNGTLIELTQTEHNKYSSVLHRYVKKGSNITDRNSGFASFRKKYWKSRATDCILRRR